MRGAAGSRARGLGASAQARRARRARRAWQAGLSGVSLAALLLALFAAGSGCSGRERDNPFDPLNPDTQGEPYGARAAAGCRAADLDWDDWGMRDLIGSRIWRATPEGAAGESLVTAAALGPSARSHTDAGLENGTLYSYTIELLFREGSARLAPVEARPGAALVWCSDPCGFGLRRLTPDGRRALAGTETGALVYDLDIDAAGRRVFATDLLSPGVVWVGPSDGEGEFAALPAPGATAVSWSAAAGALAVGAFYERSVQWMTPEGLKLGEIVFDAPPLFPEAVALRDAGCTWIALTDSSGASGRVVRARIGSATVDTVTAGWARPVALADDPEGGGCWVADRGGSVRYVRDDLEVLETPAGAVAAAMDLCADGRGGCWVADAAAGRLLRLDRACGETARVSGLAGVQGVTVDPVTQQLWVTFPRRGEVLLLSGGDVPGDTLGLGAVSGCPTKVAGDWTGGCR